MIRIYSNIDLGSFLFLSKVKIICHLKVEMQNGIPKYFIHYHGWNKNWDEWVPEARMLKYSDRNVAIQKELARAHEAKGRGLRG